MLEGEGSALCGAGVLLVLRGPARQRAPLVARSASIVVRSAGAAGSCTRSECMCDAIAHESGGA